MKFRTHFNAHEWPRQTEKFEQPTKTIPDQTMSLKEILVRYARGIPPSVRTPIYEGEDGDGIDPRRMDLAERQELAEKYMEELQQIKASIEAAKEYPKKTVPPLGGGGGGGSFKARR